MIEMGGTSQYGTRFGMAHFECAAAGSGALAIKDGLDTAYVGWNPESDMGNIEIWEQNMPMLYIGRPFCRIPAAPENTAVAAPSSRPG
jgi:acetone carboxylase alpha subunit